MGSSVADHGRGPRSWKECGAVLADLWTSGERHDRDPVRPDAVVSIKEGDIGEPVAEALGNDVRANDDQEFVGWAKSSRPTGMDSRYQEPLSSERCPRDRVASGFRWAAKTRPTLLHCGPEAVV